MSTTRDVDWVVIGSGFGGSVAALRLTQKGYSVRVLESGWRFGDHDFARSAWDARRYFFAPRLGLRGIMRLTPFPNVLIASGAGVGGGSLGYVNTLYRARDSFFEDLRWRDLADWKAELAAHYDTAERMLGVSDVTFDSDGDILLRELAGALGVEDTASRTPTATRAWVSISASRALSTPTRTSTGRDRPAAAACAAGSAWSAACAAGSAWSAAATTPRTRS